MSVKKPYHRNFRQFADGPNSGYSSWAFIEDKDYAIAPEHYTRAFLMIQEDLLKLFEYVEPADGNLSTFSFRIHGLLVRTCIEIEANFKAILRENIFNPTKKDGSPKPENCWSIRDYKRVNKTHHLDAYSIQIPIWRGQNDMFRPFCGWKNGGILTWYQAYNESKHDRLEKFKAANFENLLNAVAGLVVLLSSQFNSVDFSSGPTAMALATDTYYRGQAAIGGFFRIQFPADWSDDEKYDFDWSELKKEENKFQRIDYNKL